MGDSPTQKEATLYDLESNNTFISRDVTYYEDIFPLRENSNSPQNQMTEDSEYDTIDDSEITDRWEEEMNTNLEYNPTSDSPNNQNLNISVSEDIPSSPHTDTITQRYPKKQTRRSTRLDGYFCSFATSNGRSSGITCPMHDYLT